MREKANHRSKEWARLQRQEARLLRRRMEEDDSPVDRFLAEKIPPKLEDTLNRAFAKAFGLVFTKGTAVIERSYSKEARSRDFDVRARALARRDDKKTLRSFSRAAKVTAGAHTVAAGVEGVGLGLLGIGLPDIPLFSAVLLRSIYEIAMRFGFSYESEEERAFILLLIAAALSRGAEFDAKNRILNNWIDWGKRPLDNLDELVTLAAGALSKDLLYAKFVQGIPLVGALGGLQDGLCLSRVSKYAHMKYQRRFLRQGGPIISP